MYLMNSPYDKNTIIMIRQSNASILVHNRAINVILQTGQVTRQPYNMLCHCITRHTGYIIGYAPWILVVSWFEDSSTSVESR